IHRQSIAQDPGSSLGRPGGGGSHRRGGRAGGGSGPGAHRPGPPAHAAPPMTSRGDYAAIGQAPPDLVAVYESPQGHLGLLLRQTVVPLTEERSLWLTETRRTAGAVIASLRAAELRKRCLVLQWQPLSVVGHVLSRWHCRYAGDPVRLGEVRRVV